jgi:hypothetical protein
VAEAQQLDGERVVHFKFLAGSHHAISTGKL